MHVDIMARALWRHRRLRADELMTEATLARHRRERLRELRDFASARSPFYKAFHRGLETASLEQLPVVTKAMWMDEFDAISTDPDLRLEDAKRSLDELPSDGRLRGRYVVAASSGTAGRRSIVASRAHEWALVAAGYLRAFEWARVGPTVRSRLRVALVGSTTPWNASARLAATTESPLVTWSIFDARAALSDTIDALDAFQPDVLVGYPSMIGALASEQTSGRLEIRPRAIQCFGEVLTADIRERAENAWGHPVFELYTATEVGIIAAECSFHHGMHVFDDLVVLENVDERGAPVATGTLGARTLVTVLASRTLPIIRYELTDRIRLSDDRCPCGLPFSLVSEVEGRTDEVLVLPGHSKPRVHVHPTTFHRALDVRYGSSWQVRQVGERLEVLVQGPHSEAASALHRELAEVGVGPVPLDVKAVSAIPPGSAGKRPFVVVVERPPFAGEHEPPRSSRRTERLRSRVVPR